MLPNLARHIPKCAFGATIFSILYASTTQNHTKIMSQSQSQSCQRCKNMTKLCQHCDKIMSTLHAKSYQNYAMQCNVMMACQKCDKIMSKLHVTVMTKLCQPCQHCDKNVIKIMSTKCVHTKRLVEMSTSLNFTVSGFI